MNYTEIIDLLEYEAGQQGLKFYHYTLDHANEYSLGSDASPNDLFPVAIVPPLTSTLRWPNYQIESAESVFRVIIFLADLIDPHSDRAEKQQVVETMWGKAQALAFSLNDTLQQGTYVFSYIESNSLRIEPFFTYQWNAHLTAG